MSLPLLAHARREFHRQLQESLLFIGSAGVPTNADKDNRFSVSVAKGIAEMLVTGTGERLSAQGAGGKFEHVVAQFVGDTFPKMPHLRPGNWEVRQVLGRSRGEIAAFAQYSHLAALQLLAKKSAELASSLGNDYSIAPDVVVIRHLESDAVINAPHPIVDMGTALRADLRAGADKSPLLHASISTKWTIRSDRAQNARSEALNLIRNRKGHQPHIMAVTAEPLPSRIASLALGTGDIDCVYHFALDELRSVVSRLNNSEAQDLPPHHGQWQAPEGHCRSAARPRGLNPSGAQEPAMPRTPCLDLASIPGSRSCGYPEPFRSRVGDRVKLKLGAAAGLTQFGVNLVTLGPGGQSAMRHWHTHEDEFVYVLEGELVLVTDAGEQRMHAGDCAGYVAGVADGHHLVNRSAAPARYLEMGSRSAADLAVYPDDDLVHVRSTAGIRQEHKDGTPY